MSSIKKQEYKFKVSVTGEEKACRYGESSQVITDVPTLLPSLSHLPDEEVLKLTSWVAYILSPPWTGLKASVSVRDGPRAGFSGMRG